MSAARCSDLSRAAAEPLAGTATTARNWLLLEVRGGWHREITSPEALPPAAYEAVRHWLGHTEAAKLLFVRRPGRMRGPLTAFVVHGSETAPSMRRLRLESSDDLAGLDLDGSGEEWGEPVVLVCGHGSRDRCCALRGAATYGALASELGEDELWMSSHQGGHRFAANVLILPSSLQFGRVEPAEAPRLVADALAGSIDLECYRGCAREEPAVQAAEIAIRRATGLTHLADLRLVGVSDSSVRFVDGSGSERVALVEEVPGPAVPASCGAEAEPQRAYRAHVS